MTTGERMKSRRKELGIPVEQVASALNVSIATVYRYEKGDIEKVPGTALEPLAKVLHTSAAWLMGWSDDENVSQPEASFSEDRNLQPMPSHRSGGVIRIPVLGSIPAGTPLEAIEDIVDWEEIPESMGSGGHEYFALKVSGDSMYPEYLTGDVVIIRRQATCDSGDDCVVYVNGYDATLKTVKLNPDGGLTIQPINPSYPPRTFSAEEVRDLPVSIAGVVVEIRRKKKR